MSRFTDFFMGRTVEERESSYTDTLVNLIVSQAGGSVVKATATAAVQVAAGLHARAFASAEVAGPAGLVGALTPQIMAMAGRALIRQGELVLVPTIRAGSMSLSPAADWDITGSHLPGSWAYQLNMGGPSGHVTINRAGDEVIHIRGDVDPDRPWRGISPIESAALAGRLSAEVTAALADEGSMVRGAVLPLPVDGADPTIEALKADLKKLAGNLATVESTATGQWPTDRNGSSTGDWMPRRIGANPPAGLVELHRDAFTQVMLACGIPSPLFEVSSQTAAREGWREFLFGTVAPLGKIISDELSAKTGQQVELTWQELRASDLQGRARALDSMVKGGMPLEDARRLAGLE